MFCCSVLERRGIALNCSSWKLRGLRKGLEGKKLSLCREEENIYFGIHGNAKVVRNTSVCTSAKT